MMRKLDSTVFHDDKVGIQNPDYKTYNLGYNQVRRNFELLSYQKKLMVLANSQQQSPAGRQAGRATPWRATGLGLPEMLRTRLQLYAQHFGQV